MTLSDTIARDLQVVEADLGNQVITWDDSDYVCVVGESVESADLSEGGFTGDLIKPVIVRMSLFADGIYPQKADIVTFGGIDYEINKVTTDATLTFLHLELLEPHP